MAVPVKDADRRAVILHKFYDERHVKGWVHMPPDPSASQEEQITAATFVSSYTSMD